MQTHGLTYAEAAITSQERTFYIELKVDWNRNGLFDHALSDLSSYADDVNVDRSLAGSAPSEVMLIEGAAAAELNFTLGGETDAGLPFTAVFSPYSGLSPFYSSDPIGCEIKYSIGVETSIGVVWYPQFIGRIRLVTPDRNSNSVDIKALDRVEDLRVPVTFPNWAISEFASQRGYNVNQMVNSTWVIDHCLKSADTSSSPLRMVHQDEFDLLSPVDKDKGTRFFLSGNYGHLPNVGMMDDSQVPGFPMEFHGQPMYAQNAPPHPATDGSIPPWNLNSLGPDATGWSTSGNGQSFLLAYWGLDRNLNNWNSQHFIGFTLNNDGPLGTWWNNSDPARATSVISCHLGYHLKCVVTIWNGAVRLEVRNYLTSGGVVTPWYNLPNLANVQIDCKFGLGVTPAWGHVVANGVLIGSDAFADFTSYVDPTFDPYTAYVSVQHKAGVSDLYWVNRWTVVGSPSATPPTMDIIEREGRRPAKYGAYLDLGKNFLSSMPVTKAEDAWSVITEVAAAEMGSVFWDEDGLFRFWNRDTIIAKQSNAVRTLSLDEVEGLQISNSLDSVRNVLTSDATRAFARNETIYESSSTDEFFIPAGATLNFTVYTSDVQAVQTAQIPRYRTDPASPTTLPVWENQATYPGYVAQWWDPVTGWGERNNQLVGLRIYAFMNEDGNSFNIEIWNGYADDARVASGVTGTEASAALRISGTKVNREQNAVETRMDKASVTQYGKRNLPISGDWVQYQPAGVDQLLDFLLPRTTKPIPTTDAIHIAGDPRLQLGDTLELVDPDGFGEEMRLQIYGISRSFSRDGGLVDTLTVEMIRPSRVGIWDSAQYGRWDTTFYWSD